MINVFLIIIDQSRGVTSTWRTGPTLEQFLKIDGLEQMDCSDHRWERNLHIRSVFSKFAIEVV